MQDKSRFYVVKEKAVPEVLLKVVEAKRLIETRKAATVQEAADQVGISRSSFYKYKDDIFPFQENVGGKTVNFMVEMNDEPGLLSDVLKVIADHGANIMTIHQSIPIGGMAATSISIQVRPGAGDISEMIATINQKDGVQYLKILGDE